MKLLSNKYIDHPLFTVLLLAFSLILAGSFYEITRNTAAYAKDSITLHADKDAGKKLFQSNCATCHGINATGTSNGPSLIGVGAASVDFQVGTGRMPMQMHGPQAPAKPVQFNELQIKQLAEFVASLGPGPEIPNEKYLDKGGDLTKGGEIFRVNCAMCHNAIGAGGALTQGKYAPPLFETSEKHIYEAMITGPQNMPVFNDSNITPEEKRDLITYLKYVSENGSPGGHTLGSIGPVAEGLFIWTFGLLVIIGFTIWLTSKSS